MPDRASIDQLEERTRRFAIAIVHPVRQVGPIDSALKEATELRNIFGKARATTRQRYFAQKKDPPRSA